MSAQTARSVSRSRTTGAVGRCGTSRPREHEPRLERPGQFGQPRSGGPRPGRLGDARRAASAPGSPVASSTSRWSSSGTRSSTPCAMLNTSESRNSMCRMYPVSSIADTWFSRSRACDTVRSRVEGPVRDPGVRVAAVGQRDEPPPLARQEQFAPQQVEVGRTRRAGDRFGELQRRPRPDPPGQPPQPRPRQRRGTSRKVEYPPKISSPPRPLSTTLTPAARAARAA